MRKIDFINLIEKTAIELAAAEKNQANARLQLLKSGQASQLKQAAAFVGITPKHASTLWKKYRATGFASYLTLNYKAKESSI